MSLVDKVRFGRDDVQHYSDRYSYDLEDQVRTLVLPIQERGCLTKADLVEVGEWKSARIRSRIVQNLEELVEQATGIALATSSVRLAVHVPQVLHGVGMPVSSTLLHWFHKDPFPILDFRALWSLGIEMPASYSLEFWEEYVSLTRRLAESWDVNMRTLDRALWRFSFENQLPK
jgi:hypothetical protein